MAHALHHATTPQPNLNRFLGFSLLLHAVILTILSVTLSHTIKVSPVQAIQVKLVGVPVPQAAMKPVEKPEEIRTQDSAAPKEPPPDMKRIPPSEAKTKMVMDQAKPTEEKLNPVEAKERPPVLDKNPEKKKVVKNNLDAKVVKNPEDFLKALDFVDKLAKTNAKATPEAQPTDQTAGEGPQLQLNLADSGAVNAIKQAIEKEWLTPPGLDLRGLTVTVFVSVDEQGNVTEIRVSKSSGQAFFDNSLVRAIRKAMPLPIPRDKYDVFKDMELTFQPPQ